MRDSLLPKGIETANGSRGKPVNSEMDNAERFITEAFD
jgi:hypothetical protein